MLPLCRVISLSSAHCSIHLFIDDDVGSKVKQDPSTQHDAYLRQIVRGYLVRTLRRELTFFEKLYKSHCLLLNRIAIDISLFQAAARFKRWQGR